MQGLSIPTRLRVLFIVATLATVSINAVSQSAQPANKQPVKPSINPLAMPLTFEENQGQTDGQVRFVSRGAGYALFLTPDEAVLSVAKSRRDLSGHVLLDRPDTIRLKLEDANSRAVIAPEVPTKARSNYYLGSNPQRWRTGIPMYAQVRYQSIYPGIDMVYYGNQRRLEHDFIVAPGANPEKIRFSVNGAQPSLAANGDLLLALEGGSVRLLKPVLYQELNGKRQEVQGSYKLLAKNELGFEVGKYDRSRELVIDPVLVYSTYYGGTNVDQAFSVAINNGLAYIAGSTLSFDFPTANASQPEYAQRGDAFVLKLDPAQSGSAGVGFATYLGGSGTDEARGIALDNSGLKLYVAGYTASPNFPAAGGGLPRQYHGGNGDGFLAQLDPSTGALVSSGFLGGSGEDHILGLAYDNASNHILLTGASTSFDFPYNPVGGANIAPLSSQLYRTGNGGGSWSASGGSLPDAIEGMDVQAFLVLPNSTAFYAGGSSGVWRSNDGQSWIPVNDTLGSNSVTCLVADAADPTVVWACTPNGLYRYDSTGDQWTFIDSLPFGTPVHSILFSPVSNSTFYVATAGGVYVSTTSGASFSQLNTGLPTAVDARALAVGPSNSIYLGIGGDGTSPAIWRLSGSVWLNASDSNLPGGAGVYGDSLAWDSRSNVLYAGIEANGLWFSTDGGISWAQGGTQLLGTPFASNINKIALDPLTQTTIYLATENGIWKSTNSGGSFSRTDTGILAASVRALTVDVHNSNAIGAPIIYSGSYTQQGFVAAFNASDYSYVLATMFGGDGSVYGANISGIRGTIGAGITADPSGNIFVAGATPSSAAYIPGIGSGAQQTRAGDNDAVLMKFAPTGDVLWGTYLGGSGYDQALGIAADASSVYVGGNTVSSDFPVTAGVFQNFCASSCAFGDAFVAKFNSAGVKQWATFLGGANYDKVNSIALDGSGRPVLGGVSVGATFPQANPLGAYPGQGQNGFVTTMNTNGTGLIFSTLLGGTFSPSLPANSVVTSVATSGSSDIFAAGYTSTIDFPTTAGAPQPSLADSHDAIISKISTTGVSRDISINVSPNVVNANANAPVQFTVTVTNNSTAGPASNVKLATNLSLSDFSSANGSCSTSPAVCDFGSVPANSSVTATATHSYPQVGSFVDIFTARTDDDDPNTANNQQTVSSTITPASADLGISITAPTRIGKEYPFDYLVDITNNGPSGAADFGFTFTFDPNIGPSRELPSGCSVEGRVATCTVSSLAANQSMRFAIPTVSPTNGTSISSSATVSVPGDPNSSNNSATATTTIVNTADLYLYGSANSYVVAGAPATIDLAYGNYGPADATGALITFSLPPGVTFRSANGLNCTGTTILTCNVGSLPVASDSSQNAQLIVTVNQTGSFTVTGSIQSNEYDPYSDPMAQTLTAAPNSGAYEQYVVSESDTGSVSSYAVGYASYPYSTKAGSSPAISAIDPGGRYIFVSGGGFSGYTSVVDLAIHKEIARIHGAAGRPMVFTPDGSKLITRLASVAPGTQVDHIAIIDPYTFQIIKTISLDGVIGDQVGVNDIGIYSGVVANNKLYLQVNAFVGGQQINPVLSINLANDAITVINIPGIASGQQRSIARNSTQSRVYSLHRNTTVGQPAILFAINTSTDAISETLPLGNIQVPFSIATTQDPNDSAGQFAYISGRTSSGNIVRVVDLSKLTLLASQNSLGFAPHTLLLSSDGYYLHAFQNGARTGANNAALGYTYSLRSSSEGFEEQYVVNGVVGAVSIGFLGGNIGRSPQVTELYPSTITDTSVPTTLSVLGSNFAPDSKVKFGNLDQLSSPAVTFISSGRLDVTLPAGVPEQEADVVVTLPNTQELPTGRNVSGASYSSVNVHTSFQLNDALHVLHYGDSTLDIVPKDKNGSSISTPPLPIAFEVSSDGKIAYVSNQILTPVHGEQISYIQAIALESGQNVGSIPVLNDLPGFQDGFAISTDPVDGKPVLYYVAIDDINANPSSDQLYIVDLDPNSETYLQVKRTIRSPFNDYFNNGVWTVRATSNGRYVYAVYSIGSTGLNRIEQFDVLNGTISGLSNIETAFNGEPVPNHMRITPDDNWVLLPGNNGSVKAVNVASRDLTSPQVITISDSGRIFKNFQVVNDRLFAFDSINNVLVAFNFLPGQSNFAKLGQVTFSGPGTQYDGAMIVDPTGSYVYLSLKDQDTIVVLDANKVATSDPSAILAKGHAGLGIQDIKIASFTPEKQVDLSVSAYPTQIQITLNAPADVSYTVTNSSSVAANNVVATTAVPAGITISSADYYTMAGSGACTVALPTISCSVPSLDPGAFLSVSIHTDPITSSGGFNFLTTVSSSEADANPEDNSLTHTVTASPAADVSVTLQAPASVQPGQIINFTFTVNNSGPATPDSIEVTVDSSLSDQSITPPAGGTVSCSDSSRCTVLNPSPNTPMVFTVAGAVPNGGTSQSFDVGVQSMGQTADPDNGNNRAISYAQVVSSGQTIPTLLIPDSARGDVFDVDSQQGQNIYFSAGVTARQVLAMPNGRTAFLMNQDANYISVVDLGIQKEINRIRGVVPAGGALTPDGTQLIVSDRATNDLVVFDSSTFSIIRRTHAPDAAASLIAVGSKAFVMYRNSAAPIGVLDLNTGTLGSVAGTQTFSTFPGHLGVTADGLTVVAVGGGTAPAPATFYRIDATSNAVLQTLALPTNTRNLTLAITPIVGSNQYAYVSMDNTLLRIDVNPSSPTLGEILNGTRDITIKAQSSGISPDDRALVLVQAVGNDDQIYAFVDTEEFFAQVRYGGAFLQSATGARIDTLPSPTAPFVTSIVPGEVFNGTAQTLEINGENFSSDAVVRIGSSDWITPTSITPNKLTFTLPASTPSGAQDVVVVNRNSGQPLNSRNESGTLLSYQQLYVLDGTNYVGQWNTFIANFGDAHYTTTQFTYANNEYSSVGQLWGIAASKTGEFFITSQTDNSILTSLQQSEGPETIPLAGNVGYGDAIAVVPDPLTGRDVIVAPSTVPNGTNTDWQLNVIDADSFSPTANAILRTIRANSPGATSNPNGFAATPDGKFAFGFFNAADTTGRLAVYNLTTNTSTTLVNSTLGLDNFVQGAQVSPDSKYLAVSNSLTNTVKILDITNPTSPVLRGTITPANPNGNIPSCCNIRFHSNRIFIFDPGTMQLQVFNFLPAVPDFSAIGSITVPGSPDPVWQGGFSVSPDGLYVYVAQYGDDSMAVLDAEKVAASANDALITRVQTSRAPVSIAINPVPTFSYTADLSVVVTHSPDQVAQGTDVTFTATVTNNGPFPTGDGIVSFFDDLPAGMTLKSVEAPGGSNCSGVDTSSLQCNFGSMSQGATYTLTFVADTTNASGTLQNVGRVTTTRSTTPDPNLANNQSAETLTIGQPDLAVSIQTGAPVGGANGTLNYVVSITNNGTVPATNVRADISHSQFFISVQEGECGVEGSAFCTFSSLGVGQSVVIHLTAQMPLAAGTVTATASVTEDETDSNPDDNSVSLQTPVVDPDLNITISANPPAPVINGLVTYTATIKNNGTVASATNVRAVVSLDKGNIQSSPECGLDGNAYCNIGTLLPGASAVVHVVAQVPDFAGNVVATANVSLDEDDANSSDNTTTLSIPVGGGADLILTAAEKPVIVGGVPTYTVSVTNNGPDPAPNVVVTDELTRFQFVSAVSSIGACSYNGILITCPIGTLASGARETVSVSVVPPSSGWALSEFHAKSDTIDPDEKNNLAKLGPSGGSVGNTKAGFNVLVDALDTYSGMPASFTFSSVTKPGLTSVQSGQPAQPPTGYRFGTPARVFDLSTTATYAGTIQVTLQFAGTVFHHPNQVRLFHLENGAWVDRTTGIDAVHGLVTGVTTSLSPFILVEPINTVPVATAVDLIVPGTNLAGGRLTLNSSALDADGDTLTYRWTGPFSEGSGSVTGANPNVTLPLGSSRITLVVNDGESDSAPVTFNAVVSDFLVASQSSLITLRRGQSTSFDIAVSPKFGAFDAAVALGCANLPSGVTCSVSTPSVTPGAQGATATVTLTASASAGLRPTTGPVFAFWLGGLPVFGLLITGTLRPKNWRGWILLGMLLVILAGMVACGGGGGMTSASSSNPSSPAGSTTTVTVTGTAAGLQRSTTATLTLQ